MTWSIIARDAGGRFGIAAASRFFAVGVRLPFIASGVGAVATQALVNSLYGANGLRLLRDGHAAEQSRAQLELRRMRVAIIARFMSWIGLGMSPPIPAHACVDWCGHLIGKGWSAAGNFLAGASVLEDTVEAYLENTELPFARRLIAAMQAGEAAGGDKRGKQSADAQDLWGGGVAGS